MIKYNIFTYHSEEEYYGYDSHNSSSEHFGITLDQAIEIFNKNVKSYKTILVNQSDFRIKDFYNKQLYIEVCHGEFTSFTIPEFYRRQVFQEELNKL
jgi:hypothetical protein